jgi:hypothetical protein
MKLHLGCGQKYLDGYVNIDYPPAAHTVQNTSVADEYHDIGRLRYAASSIDEVRLHHVFEHFERFRACAYLASWNSWLRAGGIVHIEVPDFETTIRENFTWLTRARFEGVGLRHIFGSQEAAWAVHYEGYSGRRLEKITRAFGFEKVKVIKSDYKRTFNVEIIAKKVKSLSVEAAAEAARGYLSDYLVDDSDTEKRMLDVWLRGFTDQIRLSFGG